MESESIFLFMAKSELEPEFIFLFLMESIWSFLVESESEPKSIISEHPEPESILY